VVALRSRLSASWRALERFADGRWAVPTAFGIALALYAAVAIALPLGPGRDLGNYLVVYAQLFDARVLFPQPVLARTPGSPLVLGGLLDAGPVVAEAGAALLYALSVAAWFAAARKLGTAVGVVTAGMLLVYPGYNLLFHRLSTDMLFAAGFSLLALLLVRLYERPEMGRAAALGGAVALLVVLRPVSQIFLILILAPLLFAATWRARIRGSAAFAVAAAVPLLALVVHNGVRLDDYAVVRGGGATQPLFRAFVVDEIVEPDNGSASRELARVVNRELLRLEPYRSYGVDLDEFFSSGSARMHEDLIGLSDRTWGWDDDYRHLGRVGREAVLAHPGTYARGVGRDVYRLLWWPLFVPVDGSSQAGGATDGEEDTIVVNGKRLPRPSEGQPIPSSNQAGFVSTPDQRAREVWTSPTEHHVAFRDPADATRSERIFDRVREVSDGFPDRDVDAGVVERLNQLSRWFPRPLVWLVVGLAALIWRRPRGLAPVLVLTGLVLLLFVTTAAAVYAVAEYSVPVAPAFVLLAAAGFFAPRSSGAQPEG
jgi:hypothetical protein